MRYIIIIMLTGMAGCSVDYPMRNCRRVVEVGDVQAEDSTWVCKRPWYWPR